MKNRKGIERRRQKNILKQKKKRAHASTKRKSGRERNALKISKEMLKELQVMIGDTFEGVENDPVLLSAPHAEEPLEVSIDTLKVAELKALAAERGLTGYSKLNKGELVALLQE